MTKTPDALMSQSDRWALYYDEWFGLDFEILKDIIDEGETSPYRALNRYHRIVDSQTKQADFSPSEGFSNLHRGEIDYSAADFLLPTGKPAYFVGSTRWDVLRVPFYIDPSQYTCRYLFDIVAALRPQAIVELGAGDGTRLFELDFFGIDRSIAMYAAERSDNARKITDTLCAMDPKNNISTHSFRFDQPDVSFIKEPDNILFFTNKTLMFIDDVGEDFVLALAGAAKKVTCIHFEPFGHQFSIPDLPASEEQGKVFKEKGWNMSFVSILHRLQKTGRIERH